MGRDNLTHKMHFFFFADIFSGPNWVLLAVRYDSKLFVQAKYDFGVYLEKFWTCYHESL